MKLKKLLMSTPSIRIYQGNKEIEITGLCSNSKLVSPGNLFIAKKGFSDDGGKYVDEAIANGAVAILTDMPNPFVKHIVQLIHPDPRKIEGELVSYYYGHPSHELLTIGITGTSGKTTTSYLIKHLLDHSGSMTGLIGTIEYIIAESRRPADLTTPSVISNHKMLREMRNADCRAAVLEVSSQGLDQGRVDQIDFDVAIFTNLTHDHLDYHQTMDEYAKAKAKLFSSLSEEKVAIVNLESPAYEIMIKECKAKILTYGFSPKADLYAHEIRLSKEGSSFKVRFENQCVRVSSQLIGKHNILNCLAALATGLTQNIPLETLAQHLATFSTIRGRLERVENSSIFVDYAHKPDALTNVLKSLREIKTGRIITLFGCGGNRDQKKRPLMAQIAEEFSDVTIVTSDNPRNEDPRSIIKEIVAGFSGSNYIVEIDRFKAIEKAIEMAEAEDLILIAGKGHETYQIFSNQTICFDDRKVAAELLKVRRKK